VYIKQWRRRGSVLYDRKQNVVLLNASHAAPHQMKKEKLMYVSPSRKQLDQKHKW
jgi:hypothetical protein